MNRLDEILRVKRREIETLRPQAAELHRRALERKNSRGFAAALHRSDGGTAVIAEVKKASPSAGIIAPSFEPVTVAKSYEGGGADAISVLTDEPFFQGKLEYLSAVRADVRLPLLRKDFILDEIQITESAAAGADAILLIVAALEQQQLIALREAATGYQLDALVEVHTEEDLERALAAGAKVIGINNRNLATFEVDLAVTEQLSEAVPDDVVLISESGIKSANDVARLKACGVDAILVGEALMRGNVSIQDLRGGCD
jgi:indole-3-glycerol phosphate synthase